ncbi:unnamed protein product [Strongylus vulgaris]|uniref:SHD domain-containing protein n=1 Tax=Strongylus vulgaris TaxID=40348 RepID=A0A3P7LCQ9_STRVU|nr:unnamed protein product [Strongylus vulgaris]
MQELLLQASYSLSDTTLQAYDVYGKIHTVKLQHVLYKEKVGIRPAYDVYGKIHTVKLQHVLYKEKVGIRPGQISRLVDGHITKYGLPLEHTAQCTVLLKFGSLTSNELQSFVSTIEDVLFKCPAKRDTKPVYKQDEVQLQSFVSTIEDVLFKCPAKRDTKPVYKQDEVQVELCHNNQNYLQNDHLFQKRYLLYFDLRIIPNKKPISSQ